MSDARWRNVAIVAVAALALVACGDDEADNSITEPTFCILETDWLDCP